MTSVPDLAHHSDDLIDRRPIGGVALALVYAELSRRGTRAWSPANDGDQRRPAAAEKTIWLPPLTAGTTTQLYRPRAVAGRKRSSDARALLFVRGALSR